jgi:hypothetical protein
MMQSDTNCSPRSDSLLKRGKNREFLDFGPDRMSFTPKSAGSTRAFQQIPYATEQGISKGEQGTLSADQGSFRVEQGTCPLAHLANRRRDCFPKLRQSCGDLKDRSVVQVHKSMRPRVLNRHHHIDELGTSTFLELPDAFRSLTDGLRSRLRVRTQLAPPASLQLSGFSYSLREKGANASAEASRGSGPRRTEPRTTGDAEASEPTAPCPSSAMAHCEQNFASGAFRRAHFGHARFSGVAQWLQNRASAALSVPHFEQRIGFPLETKRPVLPSITGWLVATSGQRRGNAFRRNNRVKIQNDFFRADKHMPETYQQIGDFSRRPGKRVGDRLDRFYGWRQPKTGYRSGRKQASRSRIVGRPPRSPGGAR